MDREYLYDRIAGCLMGGALGDALGYGVEFDSWESIRRHYGEAGVTGLYPAGDKALISDDTQMTLFTNEGLVMGCRRSAERGISAPAESCVYQAYLCWLITQGRRPPMKPL